MIEAYFTDFTNESNWVKGEVGDYTFNAKLFNVGSRFGIDGGRVSKLAMHYMGDCVVHYDRGWDIEPSEEDMIYFDAVMELLENSEERDLGVKIKSCKKNRPQSGVYCKNKTLTIFNPYTLAKPTPDTFNIVHPTAANGISTPPSLS